jgi:hypothetical protein
MSKGMKTSRPALIISISCTFYVLILCLFAYAYIHGAIDRGTFYNSDALYFPSLFKNIFLENKHFSDWILPPSSYLFPDALLYAVAYIISNQVFFQILVFALLQSVLFFVLVSALLSFFVRFSDSVFYSALISSNVILLGLYSGDPYGLSFISAFHFGSLLSFLILSVLLLKFLTANSTKSKNWAVAFSILVAIGSAISDGLILIQFIAPILLISLFFLKGSKNKEILKFGLLLVISFMLAFVLGKVFLPEMGRIDFGFGSISSQSMMFANWVIVRPALVQLAIITWPIALSCALLFLHKNRNDIDHCVMQKRLFAFLMLVSTVLALLAVGLSNRDFTPRYLLPYLFLSPVFLFIFLSVKKSRLLVFILFSSSLLALFADLEKDKTQVPPYPEFVRCVDALAQKYKVSRGIAQYWDAIPLYVFSKAGLKVVPVLDDGSPMRWIYNTSEFAGNFSFAVIDNNATGIYKVSKTAIEKRLSKRPFEYQCYDKTVLIFNDETITLPRQSVVSVIRNSALESFVKNPRALLIMAQEESAKGNPEAAARLSSEAIALLKQSGAGGEIVRYYKSVEVEMSVTKKHGFH